MPSVPSMLQRAQSLPYECVFVALFACALAEWLYATLRANKATYVHTQGSGRVRLNQKVTLSLKAIRLHMHSWVYLRYTKFDIIGKMKLNILSTGLKATSMLICACLYTAKHFVLHTKQELYYFLL